MSAASCRGAVPLACKQEMTSVRSVMQNRDLQVGQVVANTRMLPAEGYTALSSFKLWPAGNGTDVITHSWCADEGPSSTSRVKDAAGRKLSQQMLCQHIHSDTLA